MDAPHRQRRAAFTLIEAMVALTVALAASAALTLSLESSYQHTDYGLEQTIARGLAEQLMDEILGKHYSDGNPYSLSLGPSALEQSGEERELYNDIDDYNDYAALPPVDAWGIPLGSEDGTGDQRPEAFRAESNLLDDWRQEVEVYYVDENDPRTRLPVGQVSNLRAVEVRIQDWANPSNPRLLVQLRRVVAYLPQTSL